MGLSTRLLHSALRAGTRRTELDLLAYRNRAMWSRYRTASTSSVSAMTYRSGKRFLNEDLQFGLKDAGLIHGQGFVDGQWIDAEDGKKFAVTST